MRKDYLIDPWIGLEASQTDIIELPIYYKAPVIWGIELQKNAGMWVENGFKDVFHVLCLIQWEIVMGQGVNQIVESNNRIYALLDASLNAVTRTGVASTSNPGATTYTPAIPLAPGAKAIRPLETRDVARETLLQEIKLLLQQIAANEQSENMKEILARLAAIVAAL